MFHTSLRSLLLLLAAAMAFEPAQAQLQLVPNADPEMVFAGPRRIIHMLWHNAGAKETATNIRARLVQTTSATAVDFRESNWKRLAMLPHQTVVESAPVDFPAVRAPTQFLIQWIAGSDQVLGVTAVSVYPSNLLEELKTLARPHTLGLYDPKDQVKPVLAQNGVEFLDLGMSDLQEFRGQLAVIGPFESRSQMAVGLASRIRKIAARGVAVVWLQAPPLSREEPSPSFYLTTATKAPVLLVQPQLVTRLSENPRSQLNLVYFCKLALDPTLFSTSDLGNQP